VAERTVWTFFYGSYMNRRVLAEVDLVPERSEVARLWGFEIRIQPLANLVPADGACVYGLLATATHTELTRLYRHAEEVLGSLYLPEAVLVEAQDGASRPALCYLAQQMEPKPAAADYVDRILEPARELGFPSWYLARLESFKTKPSDPLGESGG
jgi:hypothetical protein